MFGNTGRIAKIDLSEGKVEDLFLPEDLYRAFIGGSGLAAKLFSDMADMSADALSPEALLLFLNGPLAGVKLSGASRFSAAGRSPLTGAFADSSCGGYFAPALRYAGYDGLAITGRAKRPSTLLVSGGTVSVVDADALWGKGIAETTAAVRERFGARARSLVIGPAGENLVPFACVMHEAHHALGRAGLGAVMGSKLLKAVVMEPHAGDAVLADSSRMKELVKELTPRIKDYLMSQVLRDFGSPGNLEGHMYTGDVPIKNWTSNFSEEMAEALTGSTLTERFLTRTGTCAYCAVACKRVVKVDDGPFAIPEGPGPEYETVVSFGSLVGSADLAAACKAGRVCNDLGMDTISAGATIAWAMEAFERGDLSAKDTDGVALEWGDMSTVIDAVLPAMAARSGKLGALLSTGSRAAAEKTGRGSIAYTVQCKGLEAPMHDPRGGGHGHALAYAVSPRGACHVATAMHFMETGACNYPEIGFEFDLEALTDEGKPETMALATAVGAIENSACLCQYADRSLSFTEIVDLLNAATGFGYTPETLVEAGYRIFHLKRLVNYRLGLRASDDSLTERMREPARDGEPAGIPIEFDSMLERFYAIMGMDPEAGIARMERLVELGLGDEGRTAWAGK
ncbi:MAG: aldehyde ferredoxin oxidoreductase family protein [Spirochaetes bacterium]|jgi:aldehyde:ferredoxin oxidoreductase|nr:aldehyde ferredoxin oxidoreductase family protein [Spirochaetota bacterium]